MELNRALIIALAVLCIFNLFLTVCLAESVSCLEGKFRVLDKFVQDALDLIVDRIKGRF